MRVSRRTNNNNKSSNKKWGTLQCSRGLIFIGLFFFPFAAIDRWTSVRSSGAVCLYYFFFPSSVGERGDRIAARHPLCIVVIFSVLTGRSGLRSETTLHKLMEQSIHPSVVVVMAVYAVKHAPSPPLIIHIYSPLFVGLSVCLLADCCRGKGMECGVLGAPRSRAFRTAPSRYSMTFA